MLHSLMPLFLLSNLAPDYPSFPQERKRPLLAVYTHVVLAGIEAIVVGDVTYPGMQAVRVPRLV